MGIFEMFDGPTRFPGAGRLFIALDTISIHPEQEVAGIVKFPLYVEPAARTIVSPHFAALMALCSAALFPAGTVRIQLEPLVIVGQADVPCVGSVRSTVFCGKVGNVGVCPRSVAQVASNKTISDAALFFRTDPHA